MALKPPPHFFLKSMLGVVAILASGIGLLNRDHKPKPKFNQVTGQIKTLTLSIPSTESRHKGKMRYVQVTGYPKIFEVFVGKAALDFSPTYEAIDSLKTGEIITVYFDDETSKARDAAFVNRAVQFIDKGQRAYFIRGSKDKYGAYFFIITGISVGLALLVLRKNGTIN